MSFQLAVAEEDFPAGVTDAELFRFFVSFAILAPSGHNAQPWLFKIRERNLDLLADRTRALPVVDPHNRELIISCGAALEHLLVAAHRFGRQLAIDELPGSDPDFLATVRFAGDVTPSANDLAMFQAIPNRRTTRTKYDDRVLTVELRDACRELAAERGAELTTIEDETRRAEIADLVVEGDRILFGDPRFRRELAAWVHSRKKIVDASPVLAVLSTESDASGDWLATGRALSRVLLKLTASGATAAFLNQPIDVEQLRPRFRDAIGATTVPQLLMRFGYGEAAKQSVRRPIKDVLI